MRKKQSTMIKTLDGIFDGTQAKAVTGTDTGVIVVGHDDKLLSWIAVKEVAKRRKISRKLADCVYAASVGEPIEQIDWDEFELENEEELDD